jgi:hypothetical protein
MRAMSEIVASNSASAVMAIANRTAKNEAFFLKLSTVATAASSVGDREEASARPRQSERGLKQPRNPPFAVPGPLRDESSNGRP